MTWNWDALYRGGSESLSPLNLLDGDVISPAEVSVSSGLGLGVLSIIDAVSLCLALSLSYLLK